jgi:phosphatidylserine/phosphatidylglycerophosphate/cardiolipin synthase-like enzyme
MEARPDLRARLFLNVHRPYRSTVSGAVLLREFREKFVGKDWAGRVLPEVYYDPRALAAAPSGQASLHGMCVVVDDRVAFVTSANLTEAAQQRNVEAGILVVGESFARSLRAQFDALVDAGALRRLRL